MQSTSAINSAEERSIEVTKINLTLLFIMIATLSARSQKEDGDTTIYQFTVQNLEGDEFGEWMESSDAAFGEVMTAVGLAN